MREGRVVQQTPVDDGRSAVSPCGSGVDYERCEDGNYLLRANSLSRDGHVARFRRTRSGYSTRMRRIYWLLGWLAFKYGRRILKRRMQLNRR